MDARLPGRCSVLPSLSLGEWPAAGRVRVLVSQRASLAPSPRPSPRGRGVLGPPHPATLRILTPIPSPPLGGFSRPSRPLATRLVVIVLACGLASVGRGEVQTLSTDPASGIKVEVEGWAGLGSDATGRDVGLIPVTVTITNGSPVDHVWTVAPTTGFGSTPTVTPTARLAVAAGATGRATLFVGSSGVGGWSGHQMFQISGHGVSAGFHVDCSPPSHRHGGSGSLEAGISREVQAAQGNPFAKYTLTGSPLDMTMAPEDWRGWTVFRNLLLTEGE